MQVASWVRDLVWYDGPQMSLFTADSGPLLGIAVPDVDDMNWPMLMVEMDRPTYDAYMASHICLLTAVLADGTKHFLCELGKTAALKPVETLKDSWLPGAGFFAKHHSEPDA